jgi:hypothetical protein
MLAKQPNFEGNPPGRIGIPAVGVELHDEIVAAVAYGFQATKAEDDSGIVDQTVDRDVRLEQKLPQACARPPAPATKVRLRRPEARSLYCSWTCSMIPSKRRLPTQLPASLSR